MPIRPDTFLLITLTSGACIIVVGIIIVINCPLEALSCSLWYRKLRELTWRICCRWKRKKDITTTSCPNNPGNQKNYGEILVEGRPQGHGFYSAGPWTSTDTTSTVLSSGADTVQKITMMAQMGIFANAMMTPTINVSSSAANEDSSGRPNTTSVYANFLNSASSPENGFQGDNSAHLVGLQGATVCMNCEGAGFLSPPAVLNQPVGYHMHMEGSSSSASVDSAMDASDMDMDADADADADMMIMCM